jgi:glyoxylase-like metal-dependent hydrolase (beta-lactamase superfamily II)
MNNAFPFSINALEVGQMGNFVYLIQDHASKTAAIVDPAWEITKLVALTQHQGYKITDILLTHSHHDHTNGLDELLTKTDAQVHLMKAEAQFWGRQLKRTTLHQDGEQIILGKTFITVWHTPGHTPGSACYHLNGHLLTGDTLFIYGCGRCDLEGGNAEQMYHSLKRLATELPPATVIHPGHHYSYQPSSTLAEQIKGNPFMQFDDSERFIRYRMYDHKRQTPYTAVIK